MKTKILVGMMLAALAGAAQATMTTSFSDTVNTVIPDDNAAGITVSQGVTILDNANVNTVDVHLDISGGYNGDLYGYLVLQNANGTATAILLNRVGTSGGDPFGSAASGFDNITLSDSGTLGNIHSPTTAPTAGSPVPNGSYLPDGGSLNSTFSGLTGNGTWTLFLADLSAGGGQSTLVSWGLDISVVPEPVTWALIGFGGVTGLMILIRRRPVIGLAVEKFTAWVDAV